MDIKGEPYIVSEAQKFNQLMPTKISGEKICVPVEGQRKISVQFFKDRIPKVTGDTENDCIVMIRDGKIVYTNSQNQLNQMIESLDEEDQEKKAKKLKRGSSVARVFPDNLSKRKQSDNGSLDEDDLAKRAKKLKRESSVARVFPDSSLKRKRSDNESLDEGDLAKRAKKLKRGNSVARVFPNGSLKRKRPDNESLDEDDNEQNFQLDGTALFIGNKEMRGDQEKLLKLLKSGQTEETILSGEEHLKCFFRLDKAIELVSTKGDRLSFFAKHSTWKRSSMIATALDYGKGKEDSKVTLTWEMNEISHMDEYLQMDKSGQEKFIYSLSTPEQVEFIKHLHSLNLIKSFKHDDFDNAVKLFVNGFNNGYSQENIKSFLQEGSFPEYIDDAVKRELLRTTPEFYKSFVPQKSTLISEKQYGNIVMKEYWNSQGPLTSVEFYDLEKKETIIKFDNCKDVLQLNDHTVAIKYFDDTTVELYDTAVELYDTEKKETIIKFQGVYEVLQLNDHTVVIRYSSSIELYDLEQKKNNYKIR